MPLALLKPWLTERPLIGMPTSGATVSNWAQTVATTHETCIFHLTTVRHGDADQRVYSLSGIGHRNLFARRSAANFRAFHRRGGTGPDRSHHPLGRHRRNSGEPHRPANPRFGHPSWHGLGAAWLGSRRPSRVRAFPAAGRSLLRSVPIRTGGATTAGAAALTTLTLSWR